MTSWLTKIIFINYT